MPDTESLIELLDIYADLIEKQDELIFRLTQMNRKYQTELHHLREVSGFFEMNSNETDEKILQEEIGNYNDMKNAVKN